MGVARNIILKVAYDGADYHGWQIQPGKKTIQGRLTEAVRSLCDSNATIRGASRTDAGVSALGQVALAVVDTPIPTGNLAGALNDRLPPDITILQAEDAPADFDLSTGATSKLYRYTIFTGPVRPVLKIRHCWHLPLKLDVEAMTEAAGILVGTKDFKSFASAADNRENSVRTILRCDLTSDGDWIYINVEGDGFLYNMVRNIVGTLTEVRRGRWKPEKITEIIEAKDRRAAGPIAPAGGLCLMWIKY